ncbi:MAG: A/G-specific adenine glycosylase [Sphingobacteriales bacterium]|nr:A/G-specific adenine glycosylase [Sphingobacteriales bacterium]
MRVNDSDEKEQFFSRQLLQWHTRHNDRQMPWKGIKDPYKIWLSEIILQQTRVEQGLPYYEKIIAAYPTVHDLAAAPDDAVMHLWQGLGYYSRARNMLAAARYISDNCGGFFPDNYNAIAQLKGVGSYTAAAIASFAFNLPHAVVDGNVYRVLSRYFGIDIPTDSTAGKKYFSALANRLLPPEQAATYNQAIMDFGATQCTPQHPNCMFCPVGASCSALHQNNIDRYPVKEKKLQKKMRYFCFWVLRQGDTLWIEKRIAADIWKDLYQFPLSEAAATWEAAAIAKHSSFPVADISEIYRQTLTHREIAARFVQVAAADPLQVAQMYPQAQAVSITALKNFAFPKIIVEYCKAQGWID